MPEHAQSKKFSDEAEFPLVGLPSHNWGLHRLRTTQFLTSVPLSFPPRVPWLMMKKEITGDSWFLAFDHFKTY